MADVFFLSAREGGEQSIQLKDGSHYQGFVISEDSKSLTLDIRQGAVAGRMIILQENIASRKELPADKTAYAMLDIELADSQLSLSEEQYSSLIESFRRFVSRFPKSALTPEIKTRLDKLEADQQKVRAGEVKVAGKWFTADQVRTHASDIQAWKLLHRLEVAAKKNRLPEARGIHQKLQGEYPRSLASASSGEWLMKMIQDQSNNSRLNIQSLSRKKEDLIQRQGEYAKRLGDAHAKLGSLSPQAARKTKSEISVMEDNLRGLENDIKELDRQIASHTAQRVQCEEELSRVKSLSQDDRKVFIPVALEWPDMLARGQFAVLREQLNRPEAANLDFAVPYREALKKHDAVLKEIDELQNANKAELVVIKGKQALQTFPQSKEIAARLSNAEKEIAARAE